MQKSYIDGVAGDAVDVTGKFIGGVTGVKLPATLVADETAVVKLLHEIAFIYIPNPENFKKFHWFRKFQPFTFKDDDSGTDTAFACGRLEGVELAD